MYKIVSILTFIFILFSCRKSSENKENNYESRESNSDADVVIALQGERMTRIKPRKSIVIKTNSDIVFSFGSERLLIKFLDFDSHGKLEYYAKLYDSGRKIEDFTGYIYEKYERIEISEGKYELIDQGSELFIRIDSFPAIEFSFRDSDSIYAYSDVSMDYIILN